MTKWPWISSNSFVKLTLNNNSLITWSFPKNPTHSIKPLVKSAYQKNNFLISQPKHMLWVLKRTVSTRRFFGPPKTYAKINGLENVKNFTLKNVCLSKSVIAYIHKRNYNVPGILMMSHLNGRLPKLPKLFKHHLLLICWPWKVKVWRSYELLPSTFYNMWPRHLHNIVLNCYVQQFRGRCIYKKMLYLTLTLA